MFVPLHDDTPLRIIRFQFITILIILGNVIIYLFTGAFQGIQVTESVAASFGVIPADVTEHVAMGIIPVPMTFLTYMFVHISWGHLLVNMLFLWVFADNIEDSFGHAGFALFYTLCGVIAAAAHVMMNPQSSSPLIGASGAVSGVLGSYVFLYPRSRVVAFITIIPLRISALLVLAIWFGLQIYGLWLQTRDHVEVAWWAHIGGFLGGLLMTILMRPLLLTRN